jgi:CubicO group peptidase (beta-lactamase class C family)
MSSALLTLLVALCASAGTDLDSAIQRTQEAVHTTMQTNTVPGISLAVGFHGEIVYSEAFGWASVADSVRATPRTRFGIGSVTKSLTLALVQSLVDQGVMDWDAPIETWLEDFPHAGRGMTLRHIGVHQSGIDDSWASSLRFTRDHYTTDRAYRNVVEPPLQFDPGSRSDYATGSFTVIAQVVEQVTGEAFEAVLEREILTPAGMQDTVPLDLCQSANDVTRFYDPRPTGLVDVEADPSYKRAGAGYVATADDLVRFGIRLANGEICRTDELFRAHSTSTGEQTDFGLGWRVTQDEGHRVVYQPGGGPGISCYLVVYPDDGLVFAVLCNETAGPVGGRIMDAATGSFLALTDRGVGRDR